MVPPRMPNLCEDQRFLPWSRFKARPGAASTHPLLISGTRTTAQIRTIARYEPCRRWLILPKGESKRPVGVRCSD